MATPTTNTARSAKIIAGATPFGATLKDALVSFLREELGIEVIDLGTGHSIAANVGLRVSSYVGSGVRGLVVCGVDSIGSMLANKFPGASATGCRSIDEAVDARSICDSNILVLSPLAGGSAKDILLAWLDTAFKSPCPVSNGQPWSDDVQESLDRFHIKMTKIGVLDSEPGGCISCAICCLANPQVPDPFKMIPGGSVKIIQENPTSATVKFKAQSVEPAHHHTSGHEQLVLKGKMSVWNLSKKKRYDLVAGNYLFTPGGHVHMVKYHEDTKFFVKWHGHCDMFFDTAEKAIDE
ncbi:hypothetical protein EUGRSUZ_B01712 [Eucalyptus grandis]|uniref:Uncharacterized protein n=2 Tax=Eucalyptus grandis TaxID=71139 RepID=A0ACC3LRV6_EUCGR|nr:hypothetical protein EUGRSUZ_B01712 [Eucalyptus grandis]